MASSRESRFSLPPQILRLVLLTIAIVAVYLVARYFLTPPSFGQFGFYRGDVLQELASLEPVYAGKKACEECHSEQYQQVAQAEHKSVSCEACHGSGQAHAEDPDVKMAILGFSRCVRCHEENPSRPKWHKQINSRTHYTGEKCTECHLPHQPNEVP
ncbi:MAG: hypothetical protein FJ387_13780 [Verrucomicrobia bacterium]|nr:hypothetical protein [Verrucomicrobiota bacterium]